MCCLFGVFEFVGCVFVFLFVCLVGCFHPVSPSLSFISANAGCSISLCYHHSPHADRLQCRLTVGIACLAVWRCVCVRVRVRGVGRVRVCVCVCVCVLACLDSVTGLREGPLFR